MPAKQLCTVVHTPAGTFRRFRLPWERRPWAVVVAQPWRHIIGRGEARPVRVLAWVYPNIRDLRSLWRDWRRTVPTAIAYTIPREG